MKPKLTLRQIYGEDAIYTPRTTMGSSLNLKYMMFLPLPLKGIEQFYDYFIHNHMYLKKQLPETIVKQIADIRVFALDKATRNVLNAVTQFCEENKRIVTTVGEDYRRYIKENSTLLDKEIDGDFSFHDCTIY